MSAKDTKAKEFLTNNERFADIFNYYLFDGNPVIDPEDLQEKDTTKVLSLYGVDRKETQKQRWRDLLKSVIVKETGDMVYILLGVENQSDIHYAMPVKNMIYDGMNYGAQVTEASRHHRKDRNYGSDAEFLSGFKKEDKLTPVITLTVYWGADEWDAPRCLHDMFPDSSKGALREVLEIIQASNDRNRMKSVLESNPKFRCLENEAVSAINIFAGLNISVDIKEGKTDMCKAWEEQWLDGKSEGIEQGREQGIEALILDNLEDGRTEEVIINKLIKRFEMKAEDARRYFDKYAKETV